MDDIEIHFERTTLRGNDLASHWKVSVTTGPGLIPGQWNCYFASEPAARAWADRVDQRCESIMLMRRASRHKRKRWTLHQTLRCPQPPSLIGSRS